MTPRFRIALVGCGGMANTWVEYALQRSDAEIVALVDLNADTSRELAAKHGLSAPTFTDLPAALSATGATLVFDVTVPEAHEQVTTTALAAGCHVFGEKPLATSMAQARRMVAAAERSGRTYAVMQNRRFQPQIRALRGLIQAGTIGTPGQLTAQFFIGAHFGGFRDQMDSPLLLDMAVHTFDQARFITGQNAVAVYCREFHPPGSWYAGAAAASCIFELEGGLVFTYTGSWCAEGARTSWEGEWRVVGSQGTAIWDGAADPSAEVVDPGQTGFLRDTRRVAVRVEASDRSGHFAALDEMFSAVLEGRPPETDGTDNLHTMAMVFGALESARTGQRVTL